MAHTGSVECCNVLQGTMRFCKNSSEFRAVCIDSITCCEIRFSTVRLPKVLKVSPRFQQFLRGSGRFGCDLICTSVFQCALEVL